MIPRRNFFRGGRSKTSLPPTEPPSEVTGITGLRRGIRRHHRRWQYGVTCYTTTYRYQHYNTTRSNLAERYHVGNTVPTVLTLAGWSL